MRLMLRPAVIGMVVGVAALGALQATGRLPDWQALFGAAPVADSPTDSAAAPGDGTQPSQASAVPVSPALPDPDFNTMPFDRNATPDNLMAQMPSILSPYLLGPGDRAPSESLTQIYPPAEPDAAASADAPAADAPPRLPTPKDTTRDAASPRALKSLREANASPAMFNEAQIASIKARLKLSRQQEQYWPPVETALRAVTWQRHGNRKATLDLASLQRLNEAARTMLIYLRDDQKNEVKMLASIVGLRI